MNMGLAVQILSLPSGGSGQDWQSDVVFGWTKVTLQEFYATWGQSPLVLVLSVTEASTILPSFLPHGVVQEAHAMLSSSLQRAEGIDRARVLTGGKSQHIGQIWPKHTQSRVCSVVILQLPILHFRPCWANWVLWKQQAIGRPGPMHVWISTNISSVCFLSVSLLYRCPFSPVHFLMWIWVWTGSLHEYMERSSTIHPSVTE